MKFTILGSGGNSPTSMPTCDCRVCTEAREKGGRYARRGNAVFFHDANALIDAPELVWQTLNRERIDSVEYVFLTHFHADHVLGLRTLQPLGIEEPPITDFVGDVPTLVVSPITRERTLNGNEAFAHLTDRYADVRVLDDGEQLSLGEHTVTHHTAPIETGGERAVSGFLFESDDTAAFLSPDENRHFDFDRLPSLDLWIKECGYFAEGPDGEQLLTERARGSVVDHELSFAESLEQVRVVDPDRTVLTEIEELYRRSYDDYCRLERDHDGLVEFAYDGMTLDV